jgi:small subunit ribosomal protein S16
MRLGRRKRPFYRIVVADSKARRDGAFIDIVGYYDPLKQPADVKLDEGKALKWLSVGALPTDTARSILSKAGLMAALAASRDKSSNKQE